MYNLLTKYGIELFIEVFMSSLFVTVEKNYAHGHTGVKARDDIASILSEDLWIKLELHKRLDPTKLINTGLNIGDKIRRIAAIPVNILDWSHINSIVSDNDILLVQFPLAMYPKVSLSALHFVSRMKSRGVKFIFLIHDLESLRGYTDTKVEEAFLNNADVIIAHNSNMCKYLLSKNYCDKLVSLECFDYLAEYANKKDLCRNGIDIAGNLSPEKAGYIYKLDSMLSSEQFNLYGPNMLAETKASKFYKGNFSPLELMNKMNGKFGLVWDGDSPDTCSGKFGDYLRYNNPYKLSLYLACGMPVMIWNQAAQSSFVESNGIGLTVSSIPEGIKRMRRLSNDEFHLLQERAEEMGSKIREGFFTRLAISSALKIINE
jgi:hypothetical protein